MLPIPPFTGTISTTIDVLFFFSEDRLEGMMSSEKNTTRLTVGKGCVKMGKCLFGESTKFDFHTDSPCHSEFLLVSKL